ncbi:hypothetical protein LCGC14_1262150 [marine sediment metagenome]|uniref:TATA-box-binding protein n=1 Tax=marine sediment metagenome TaxID=412755 RepID=A0A0F9L0C2_9ZZZZ|nr:MAG: TATA-box-binding protein [Candidatus Lokiarchaeum sp. GC14_75]HEC36656.1 hypothetical protein [bacterium]
MLIEAKSNKDTSSLTYTIQNIVIKSSLNVEYDLNLSLLASTINNTQYEKSRFPGLFIRFQNPKCVVIVFRSGKLILTGIKIFTDIDLIIERLVLQLNGILPKEIAKKSMKTEVVNIVTTANLYKEIDLNKALITLENAVFDPEIFPGLIFKSLNPVKSSFLIFSNGKIVLTGIREERMIEPVLIHLGRLLKRKELFK